MKATGHSFEGQQKAGQSIDNSTEGRQGRDPKGLGTLGRIQFRLESNWEEVCGRESASNRHVDIWQAVRTRVLCWETGLSAYLAEKSGRVGAAFLGSVSRLIPGQILWLSHTGLGQGTQGVFSFAGMRKHQGRVRGRGWAVESG